jgi:hypothetical protein
VSEASDIARDAPHQTIEHACAHKKQGVYLFNRRLKLAKLLEHELGFKGLEGMRQYASRKFAPSPCRLSQPRNQVHFRQCGQLTQRANAPCRKRLRMIRR